MNRADEHTEDEYGTSWDDRDFLLDYKSVNLESIESVPIFGVPVDNVTRDEAVALVLDLLEKKSGPHHLFFIDPVKLMRIRPGKKLSFIAKQARLILPDGAGIGWVARRLGTPLKERIPMIAFIMDIVRLSVKKELTIYLLGSRTEYIERVFSNFQKSFPGVRIIGRQSGYFESQKRETLVKESLRKSSPDIIFIGMGFGKQEKWIRDNWQYLSRSIVIGVDGAFDILSGKVRKAPDWAQTGGKIWFWRTLIRPYRIAKFCAMCNFFLKGAFQAGKAKK